MADITFEAEMRFTSQEEYGLRCMIQLARNEEQGPMTIEEIANCEGLTTPYVGKLLRVLLKGGLIESTRGKNGGYMLARPAVQISVAEILDVLGGKLFDKEHCKKYSGNEERCVNSRNCSVRALWITLEKMLDSVLSNTMLKDLVLGERDMNEWLRYNRRPETAEKEPAETAG